MNTPHYIPAGYGFTVTPCDFARAKVDTPIELAPAEYAGSPRRSIGYIAENKESTLGFLRNGHNGKVRVLVDLQYVREVKPANAWPTESQLQAESDALEAARSGTVKS